MTRLARALVLTAYFGLLTTLVAGIALLAPPEHVPRALALLVFGAPLLLPLRGLLHGRPYTHAWCALLALFYLMHGIYQAAVPGPGRSVGLLETALATLLFAGCVLYARWRSRELRKAASRSA